MRLHTISGITENSGEGRSIGDRHDHADEHNTLGLRRGDISVMLSEAKHLDTARQTLSAAKGDRAGAAFIIRII